MFDSAKKEFIVKDLKRLVEFYKQKQLLAAIFFDGEDRSKYAYYKNKRKEAEMLKAIEDEVDD